MYNALQVPSVTSPSIYPWHIFADDTLVFAMGYIFCLHPNMGNPLFVQYKCTMSTPTTITYVKCFAWRSSNLKDCSISFKYTHAITSGIRFRGHTLLRNQCMRWQYSTRFPMRESQTHMIISEQSPTKQSSDTKLMVRLFINKAQCRRASYSLSWKHVGSQIKIVYRLDLHIYANASGEKNQHSNIFNWHYRKTWRAHTVA